MRKAALVLAAAFAAGCATTSADRDEEVRVQRRVVTRTPAAPAATYDRNWLEIHSDASAAGRVSELEGEELSLEPYANEGEELEFRVSREIPLVASGPARRAEGLAEGRDVRVYYRATSGERPVVVGVELLEPEDAARLRDEAAPMAPPAAPTPFPDEDGTLLEE